MMNPKEELIIIGGGLSGLVLLYLLQKKDYRITLLEASSRLGGRIQTVNGKMQTPLELGATWFADKHENLSSLLKDLGLHKYPQYTEGISFFQTNNHEPPQQFVVPPSEEPSYRIAGGTQTLVDTLINKLKDQDIQLGSKVTAIDATNRKVVLETANGRNFQGDRVVICIPPQLAAALIRLPSEIPDEVQALLPTVQTWMAGAIKFTLEYEKPFWREKGYSGMLFSHSGIVTEMYDHTNNEENKYGFTGFLHGGTAGFSAEVRKANVLKHVSEIFGAEALQPTAYFDKVWNDEYIIQGNTISDFPHQNNGHPFLQRDYIGGKIMFCGTETATQYAGYMEGAVQAAIRVADRLS